MIIIRFERYDGIQRLGLFRRTMPVSEVTKDLTDELSTMHRIPREDVDYEYDMRAFNDTVNGKPALFGFTTEAFKNAEMSRILVKLAKQPDIRVRVLVNPNVTWVSASGIQVAFTE